MRSLGYSVNTWDKFLIEIVDKIKKKWLKKDKEQLKQLELQSKKLGINTKKLKTKYID